MTLGSFEPMSPEDLNAYLLMARALISQGAVDVDKPSEPMVSWARRAVRSADAALTEAIARLAEGTALARAERYIELQLVAPGTTVNDAVVDLEAPDRFRLLRLVASDHQRFRSVGLATSLEGAAAVLFSAYDEARAAAAALAKEFASEAPAVLLYACTFFPALPEDFLEEGMDPLAPARDFLSNISDTTRTEILDHVGPKAPEISL